MGYHSKNIRETVKPFSVEVDRTFLKVRAKYIMVVTKIGEVIAFSSSSAIKIVLSKHVVLIMRIISIIINMDDIF